MTSTPLKDTAWSQEGGRLRSLAFWKSSNKKQLQQNLRPERQAAFEEEKKESFSGDLQVHEDTTRTMNPPLAEDSLVRTQALPQSVLSQATVAALWNEVTWYPVVLQAPSSSSAEATSTPTTKPRGPTHHRRWMAVQGSVSTDGAMETCRPFFRQPAAWTAGEPYRAESWTPLVRQVRQALLRAHDDAATTAFNHVTLEAWQWNEDPKEVLQKRRGKKQRSVTVAHERIDPTLDLEPNTHVVRVFLTGPLLEDDEHEEEKVNQEVVPDSDASSDRVGCVYLRPKRYDRNNQRRATPRPQQALPVPHNGMFTLQWQTNQSLTHEISFRPGAAGHVTLMLTFRQVSTFLVEHPARVPRIIGRALGPKEKAEQGKIEYSEQDVKAEWKRLSQAFFEEKRQEGLTTEQVYGKGSFLVPQAKTKPCVAKLSPSASFSPATSQLDEDGLSVATPTSTAHSFTTNPPTPQTPTAITNSPIFDLHLVDDTEFADEEDDDADANRLYAAVDTSSAVAESTEGSAVALLVVDLQNDFLGDDPSFSFCRTTHKVSPLAGQRRTRLLKRIDELAKQVREQQGVVVFCRSIYGRWSRGSKVSDEEGSVGNSETNNEEGEPAVTKTDSDSIASSTATRKAGTHLNRDVCCTVGSAGSDFFPDALKMIQEDDLVMTKQWYSAFFETSLHAQLQRLGVKSVVVCGVTTNHSVSATVRSAAHLGYHVILSSDGTAQIDPSLQAETEAKLQQFASILAPKMSLKEILAPAPAEPRSLAPNGRDRQYYDGWSQRSAIGSGDSVYLPDFFDPQDAKAMRKNLRPCHQMDDQDKGEVTYSSHTERGGRGPLLTAYQCARNAQGDVPMCRMAALDNNLEVRDWSASVAEAVPDLETQAGHAFNFCRIVQHRSTKDSLRFRSDLCLDMQEGTNIAIVALGDGLVLELRPKPGVGCKAGSQKVALRDNSLFLLGPETNRLYQYTIRCSRKASRSRSRMSLTFRALVTFRDQKEGVIYGPGARYSSIQQYRDQRRKNTMWEGAGMIACGASSLTLLQARNKMVDSIALAAAPVLGIAAIYGYMNYRRKVRVQDDESRLEQIVVRCNWQPLRFSEAKHLLLNASDAELFGVSRNTEKCK